MVPDCLARFTGKETELMELGGFPVTVRASEQQNWAQGLALQPRVVWVQIAFFFLKSERQKDIPSAGSLRKWSHWPGPGQAEARSSSTWVSRPKDLGHLPFFPLSNHNIYKLPAFLLIQTLPNKSG